MSDESYLDWMMDQPLIICIPLLFFTIVLPIIVIILGGLFGLYWLYGTIFGFPKPADPYFYENGMRCTWEYYLVGKVTVAQKICEVLPQLTPVVRK